MKNLYVIPVDCGDGSVAVEYTFDEKWIEYMEAAVSMGDLEEWNLERYNYEFQYGILTVPDECTLESLGIPFDAADD